ncbi:hypothetical protein AGMMS50276_26050 [Synergistales bacterium]|nr:hypothetical protein AGMMS50276_26050 [Synergistales bacterium]
MANLTEDPLETNDDMVILLTHTTTTQLHYYEEGNERCFHPYVRFKPNEGFGFVAECLIDLSLDPDIQSKTFWDDLESKGEIEEKGRISKAKLKQIYCTLCSHRSSMEYSPIIKRKIRASLVSLGIKDLPVVEKRKKK